MAGNLYRYVPNAGAAGTFAALFLIAACTHIWSMKRTRSWFYIPLIIGAFFEAIGYALRLYSHFNPSSLTGYAGQSVLILVALPLIAATIYMLLGRIIRALYAEMYSPIPPRWLARIFVTGDVFCFLLQSTGGGIQASADGDADKSSLGKNVIVGGLVLQVVLFAVFVVVAAVFCFRLHGSTLHASSPWKKQMVALFVASGLILVRNIVRIVEYAQGFDGYIITHEVFIYVFDAVMMLGVVVLLWVVYAGRFLAEERKEENFGLVERPDGDSSRSGQVGNVERKIGFDYAQYLSVR